MANRVIAICDDELIFDNGDKLYSYHTQHCCENHYLSFDDVTLEDFEGLQFDLSGDAFFRRIPNYGIELIPVVGHSVKIPGYAENNGCYSSNLALILESEDRRLKQKFDIEECQI